MWASSSTGNDIEVDHPRSHERSRGNSRSDQPAALHRTCHDQKSVDGQQPRRRRRPPSSSGTSMSDQPRPVVSVSPTFPSPRKPSALRRIPHVTPSSGVSPPSASGAAHRGGKHYLGPLTMPTREQLEPVSMWEALHQKHLVT